MLSEDTASRLLEVMREHCTDIENCPQNVRESVTGAAIEARTCGLTAEQFVIWVKQIWDDFIAEGVLPRSVDTMRAREAIVSLAIKAYYVQ